MREVIRAAIPRDLLAVQARNNHPKGIPRQKRKERNEAQ